MSSPRFSQGELVLVLPLWTSPFSATVLDIVPLNPGDVFITRRGRKKVVDRHMASPWGYYLDHEPADAGKTQDAGLPWPEHQLRKIDPPGDQSFDEVLFALRTSYPLPEEIDE